MTRFIKATYHSDDKTAEFIADDGRHCLRAGGSLPWRTNNAGNLVSPLVNGVPSPKKTKGYIGFAQAGVSNHYFFIFPDYETGRAELKASLLRKYSDKSLRETIKLYAPSGDQNNTEKYIKDLSKLSGVAEDTKIKDLTTTELDSVMDGIEKIEGYHADENTRKEIWVNVSHIQATDGTRPIAGEEIVVKVDGKETTLKSNAVGMFPPVVHGKTPVEVQHKTVDGTLKSLPSLPAEKSQHLSLWTRIAEYVGISAPIKPIETAIAKKQPLQYTVKPHDTLGKIASTFKISVAQLKKDNHLVRDIILPGQVLGINSPPPASLPVAQPKQAIPKVPPPVKTVNGDTVPAKPTSGPKPKNVPTAEAKTTPARTREGSGEPVALITPEEGVAPWMKYALAEAEKWKGAAEGEIEKTTNFHKEVKDGQSTMSMTTEKHKDKSGKEVTIINYHSWCAAFANWCLMKAGYPIEFGAHAGRAQAFYMHINETTPNPLYVEIDEPIYGALGLVFGKNGLAHHVGFVYGKFSLNENYMILLGGNQSDLIQFSPFQIKKSKNDNDHLRYFIPKSYVEQAKKDAKNEIKIFDRDALNQSIGIKVNKKSSANPNSEGTT